jgi:hypothetical protein
MRAPMERTPDPAEPSDVPEQPHDDDVPAPPEGLPDPATIAEAEELNRPLPGPHVHGVSDPTDPVADRQDATGRG